MIENRSEPRISVQRRNASSLVQGHLGTGALLTPDLVVTTRPAAEAIRDLEGGPVEVVLGPSSFDLPFDGVVERRTATQVHLLDVTVQDEDGPTLLAALITLEPASAYLPVLFQDPGADPARQAAALSRALIGGADILQAFEAIEVIPPGFQEEPNEDWRNAAEQHLRRNGTQHRRVAVSLSARGGICTAMPWLWFC